MALRKARSDLEASSHLWPKDATVPAITGGCKFACLALSPPLCLKGLVHANQPWQWPPGLERLFKTVLSEPLRQDMEAGLGGLQAHNKLHGPDRSDQRVGACPNCDLLCGAHQFVVTLARGLLPVSLQCGAEMEQ